MCWAHDPFLQVQVWFAGESKRTASVKGKKEQYNIDQEVLPCGTVLHVLLSRLVLPVPCHCMWHIAL